MSMWMPATPTDTPDAAPADRTDRLLPLIGGLASLCMTKLALLNAGCRSAGGAVDLTGTQGGRNTPTLIEIIEN